MLPMVQIGSLALQVPVFILFLSLWLGITLSEKKTGTSKVPAAQITNLIITGLLSSVIGARLVYVIVYWDAFSRHFVDILSFNPAMLDIQRGILIGILAAFIYLKKKGMPAWNTLDGSVPFLAVAAVGIDLMNLASGNGYGTPTSLPWGIQLIGAKRHPSQLYEALAAVMIAWLVFPATRKKAFKIWTFEIPGVRFLIFVGLSAGARLFLDAFRASPGYIWGGVHSVQVASWIILAICFWLNHRRKKAILWKE